MLIRGGTYALSGGLTVSGKSLTIQAANPLNVIVGGGLTISGLSSAQSVQLSGLTFYNSSISALRLENSDGLAALQGTDLLGATRFLDVIGSIGADGRLESVENLGLLPPGFDILHLYAQSYYVLPASTSFPRKLSSIPRVIQLGAGGAVQRLDGSF